MTESLKSLLAQQAASVAFRPPDLDAIAHHNNQRLRRRRMMTVLGGAAAVIVVATTAVVLSTVESRRPDIVAGPWPTTSVSWAGGSTIHNGDDTIEVGHNVRAYVRTSVGFVTLDGANNVYSVTGGGVTRIGQALAVPEDGTGYTRLYSDPRGTLAGWVGSDGSGPAFQVHDQATGKTRNHPTAGASPCCAVFYAIDDRTAYWRVSAGAPVVAVNLDTGEERPLTGADQSRNLEIWSAENGVLAFTKDRQPRGNLTSLNVGRSIDDARRLTFGENAEAQHFVRLSPTGAWVSYPLFQFDGPPIQDKVLAFTAQVRDTASGGVVTLKLPPAGFTFSVVWLDDTTLQVLAIGVKSGMYMCRVTDGTCRVAADLPPSAVEGTNLVMPTGEWIGG